MPDRTAKEAALDYFAQKFNCAEATLLGLCEALGIEENCVPRIATGFGAGLGFSGDTCGAVTGAIMAIGLKLGRERAEDQDAKLACYKIVGQLVQEFEQEFGNVGCNYLTKCNMRTPEGRAKATELNLHSNLCPKYVAFAAEVAYRLIEE